MCMSEFSKVAISRAWRFDHALLYLQVLILDKNTIKHINRAIGTDYRRTTLIYSTLSSIAVLCLTRREKPTSTLPLFVPFMAVTR